MAAAGRIIKYLNLAIAGFLAIVLAMVYWYAWRPLPEVSGTITVFLGNKATASRDALGVAHIRAADETDALFVQGYVTAQDRLWQMDGIRRLAAGNLAEILGPAGLETDRESRRLRLRRTAEEAYLSMPARDRGLLAAYARGVNAFIDTHRNNLPVEFTLLAYDPLPWSGVDSVLVGLHMFRTLTSTWKDEIAKRNMLAAGDAAKVNFLFPARSGAEPLPGSNAWVLSGAHTLSGRPLLSNDMHLEWSLPGIWYMVHLQAPGLNVAGVSLPGVPGVVAGHNERIAWGITNLQFDVQDLYLEKFDDATGRYLFRGQPEQARLEREIIRVKNGAPAEVVNWVTRHGPLFLADGPERMSLRWVACEPGPFQFALLDVNRARDWREFTAALARFPGPAANFVYADVDGNIGYHVAGKIPIRKNYAGDVPVDGASGEFEWQGFIPFDQLPSSFNPPGGMIVTANQNPFPAAYAYPVSGNFAPPHRASQIRALLGARGKWRAEELLAVQKDVYSAFSHYLSRSVVAAYEKRRARSPGLEDAVALLRAWNGQMDKDQAAPFLVTLVYQHLRRAAAEAAAPGKGMLYEFIMAPAVLETLLHTRPPGWFHDYDQLLLRVLVDAVEEGRRMQGRDVSRWRYGNYLRLLLANPLIHRLPVAGKYFDIGPAPMSGSSTTVKQTSPRLGPSMRMNADLSDWDHSLLNVLAGQSGQILSRHYRDQWRHYYYAQSYRMQFRNPEAEQVLVFEPGL